MKGTSTVFLVLGRIGPSFLGRAGLWLQATLPAMGGIGVLCSSFIDSSFVPLPLVTDLLVIELSSLHPLRMPVYATLAALGSLGGCIVIYWLARKGGQAFYLKTQGHSPEKVEQFIEKHPVACVVLPAAAPFPVPFKPFVIAQGVFQVPFPIFLLGTLAGRSIRFFIEGYLGVKYGEAAKEFVLHQKWHPIAVVVGLGLVYLLVRQLRIFRKRRAYQPD